MDLLKRHESKQPEIWKDKIKVRHFLFFIIIFVFVFESVEF